ncbi:hypothetical protein DFH28DRAFT_948242, partial [Melampsora americana]
HLLKLSGFFLLAISQVSAGLLKSVEPFNPTVQVNLNGFMGEAPSIVKQPITTQSMYQKQMAAWKLSSLRLKPPEYLEKSDPGWRFESSEEVHSKTTHNSKGVDVGSGESSRRQLKRKVRGGGNTLPTSTAYYAGAASGRNTRNADGPGAHKSVATSPSSSMMSVLSLGVTWATIRQFLYFGH